MIKSESVWQGHDSSNPIGWFHGRFKSSRSVNHAVGYSGPIHDRVIDLLNVQSECGRGMKRLSWFQAVEATELVASS